MLHNTLQAGFIRHILGLLLLSLLAACGYPPILKTEPEPPPQPFLAKFTGHAPVAPSSPIAPLNVSPASSQALPPSDVQNIQAESSIELAPIHITMSATDRETDAAAYPNPLDSNKSPLASKEDVEMIAADLNTIAATDNTDMASLPEDMPQSETLEDPEELPQPGQIDMENIQDLHQVRIQLMAESP